MTKMTDNTIEKILEQMGKTYRSWEPRRQRVEATWNFLVQELESADAPVAVRMPIFSLPSFANFFHMNVSVLRPVLAVLVLGVFSVGSLMRVASASLPGDTLYTVKLAKEQAQVLLTRDNSDRAKLSVQFAIERADEVKRVVASTEPREQKAVRLAVATTGLTTQVAQATDALATLSDKKALVSVMQEGAGQIVTILHDAKNEAAKGNGIVAKEVDKAISAMTETQELVQIAAHPPTTLALSVPAEVVIVPTSMPDFQKELQLRSISEVIRQPASLIHPAQSVFSLPMAESIASGENLSMAQSIQSAR